MNRPLFDPKHLRIAAEVRAKAWRRRWLVGVMVTIVVFAQIELHVRKLVQ